MRNLSRAAVILLLLFLVFPSQAASSLEVVINEIAWMGTEASPYDEWIELYNNTDSSINLEDWVLKASDGTPEINLTGRVSASSFYLLERTDDNTLANIIADQIYEGALENSGENLELYDSFGNLIDSVDCSSGWFRGDNSTKQTMERKSGVRPGSDPLNWGSSQNPSGTPKTENSLALELEVPLEEPIPELEIQPTPEQPEEESQVELEPLTYPSGIFVNEILPSPEGPDAEEEWLEIFNQNNFEVGLSGWQLTDIEGKTTSYTFPEGVKISPQGFLVFSRPTTKITLNNDGDGLKLVQPNRNIIDSATYRKAPRGQSYNRTDSQWVWSTTLTPGSVNIIPAFQPAKEEKSEVKPLEIKKGLATVGEPFQQAQGKQIPKSFLPLLIALAIAIFSGIIILILKRKLKTSYNKSV